MNCSTIMFHHFHNQLYPKGQGSISEEKLYKIIKSKKYHIISASEWIEKTKTRTKKSNEFCLTFDDNLKCQYEIALPVLEYFGITAIWFINTGTLQGEGLNLEIFRYFRSKYFEDFHEFYVEFIKTIKFSRLSEKVKTGLENFNPDYYLEQYPFYSKEDKIYRFLRDNVLTTAEYNEIMQEMIDNKKMLVENIINLLWMNSNEIKNLSKNKHVIGLHSHSHPTVINKFSYDNQKEEYVKNYNILKSIIDDNPIVAAYPCNSYNTDTFKILGDLGVELGFRSNDQLNSTNLLELPRIDHSLLEI